ncbi:fungal-specific transcription factor domain-containing protein [Bisporella sp. PMI_857]|nr:fungal-specific transcription factor domain-containing protein [Bisporella sp. PMI_857]
MSITHASRGMRSNQPFQCFICQTRFTRHENLKRHAALHSRSQDAAALPCDFCQATFSRPDLRHRHMKRKHLDHEQRPGKERPRRDPPAPRSTSDGWSPQADRVYSASPPESQDGLRPQNSRDAGELEMDSEIWDTQFRYAQHRLDPDYPAEGTNLAPNAPTSTRGEAQLIPGPLVQRQSMSESTCICQIVQDAADLERNLLLETSFLKAHHVDNQLPPLTISQPVSFNANLANLNINQGIPESLVSNKLPQFQDEWSPSALQITRGCDIFFTHVSHFVPFLHQPTFDATQIAPHLVLSILCLAYQYGEDPECGDQVGSGVSLSERCFHRARALIASNEGRVDGLTPHITIVQTYLLLQICAIMYLCGDNSTCGLKMHSSMISLARAGGMMQPLTMESTATQDLESLWREFIKVESRKRTLFAVHQIDALWYQLLSIPRSISHLEIKHELPCPEDHWAASSSTEWAHRRLVARNSGHSVQYADAVRLFLSLDADLNSIPAFDPYGAINIAQFLISSAREISGWSTMTGMISMERLGALKTSLVTLKPFIRQQADTADAIHAATSAATWETAMIELQMWSPAHTGGIVEASIDAVLNQSTHLAPSYEFLCGANTAKAVKPHVDWFLRYLDTTLAPESEAPWVTLYAYKAFLIAWQLVNGGLPGAMQVVGIQDGDMEGALMWARKVFQRRSRWQLGKLIIPCLDELGR